MVVWRYISATCAQDSANMRNHALGISPNFSVQCSNTDLLYTHVRVAQVESDFGAILVQGNAFYYQIWIILNVILRVRVCVWNCARVTARTHAYSLLTPGSHSFCVRFPNLAGPGIACASMCVRWWCVCACLFAYDRITYARTWRDTHACAHNIKPPRPCSSN